MFHMERRQETRFRPPQPIRVTLLDPSHREIEASVINISAGGMCLQVANPIPAGTSIKIETSEILLLGDICYCSADNDAFRVGFVAKHRMALRPARQAELASAR